MRDDDVASAAVQLRVLGPIEIVVDANVLSIAAPKERALLAVFVANANGVVSSDRLIDELWGEHPPRSARKTLQTYVSHLRQTIGDALASAQGGYLLRVGPDDLDAACFERLVSEGRVEIVRGAAESGAATLGRALALWRGPPFQGSVDSNAVLTEARRLEEIRLDVEEDWFDARLAGGDHRLVAAELELAVNAQPLRERRWALWMVALYRCGRQADALRAYQRARRALIEELGVEPGPELQAVESAILTHDPTIGSTSDPGAPRGRSACRYVETADGLKVAYWTCGDSAGPDLVFCAEWTFNLELLWEIDELRPLFERFSACRRLIAVQRRGTGLSDRGRGEFAPPEVCVADIDAVLAELGVDGVSIVGWGHGGQVALAYGATQPTKVTRLALINSYARLSEAPDYAVGHQAELLETFLAVMAEAWGQPSPKRMVFAPSIARDPRLISRVSRVERLTATPREAVEIQRAVNGFDVRWALPLIGCPVLIVFATESLTGRDNARYLAEHLPDARYVELAGHFMPHAAEVEALAKVVDEFLDAAPRSS